MLLPASPASNPLLEFSGLPRFGEIAPEHVGARGRRAARRCAGDDRAVLRQAAAAADLGRLRDCRLPPHRTASTAPGVRSRISTPSSTPGAARGVQRQPAQGHRVPRRIRPGRAAVCGLPCARRERGLSAGSNPVSAEAIENELRDFRLSGAELAADDKARLKQIEEELAASPRASRTTCSTRPTTTRITPRMWSSSPAYPQTSSRPRAEAAAQDRRSGWKLTLRMPCYQPVLQYADNHALRETLLRAYADARERVRQPRMGQHGLDSTHSQAASRCRAPARLPQLCGSFAGSEDGAHTRRGPGVPATISSPGPSPTRNATWLSCARSRARARASGAGGMRPGVRFRKLRKARYSFSDQEVKQYFPGRASARRECSGSSRRSSAFASAKAELRRGIPRFVSSTYSMPRAPWSASSILICMRAPHKRGGAWMEHAINRRRHATGTQHPVAYLVCNFSAPVTRGRPSSPRAVHPRRGADAVSRIRARAASPAHPGRRAWRIRSGGRRMGRDRTTQPVHGKLLLGMGGAAPDDRARRDGRAAATGAFRAHACGEKFSERPADAAPAGVCALRHASALRFRPRRQHHLRSSSPGRFGARSRSRRARTTTARPTRSPTSSQADTRRGTTATSGRRCFPPTPTACSRSKACSRPRRAHASATRSWRRGEAGLRWNRLWPSGVGRPKSMPY